MRVRLATLALLVLVAAGCASASPPQPSTVTTPPATTPPATAAPVGFVHRSGAGLVDGNNQPVRLRGVNLGGWLLWEGWMWAEAFDFVGESAMVANLTSLVGVDRASQFRGQVRSTWIDAGDFQQIRAAGFNVVRVPFNYRMLETDDTPGVYLDSGWQVLDHLMGLARAAGVYVVLDMHAAPCGQSLSFTADFTGPYMWLWPACMDRAINLWRAIAARYATDPVVAGYDLLNEVVTGDAQLADWDQRAATAIRSVDPNHLLVFEGNNIARDFAFLPSAPDPNAVLSIHDYSWMSSDDLSARLPGYREAAGRLGLPVWVGEFGQADNATIARYRSTFDADPLFVGWAAWSWKGAVGTSLRLVDHTAASRKLVDWMTNTGRPRPTVAEAEAGMADWLAVSGSGRTRENQGAVAALHP